MIFRAKFQSIAILALVEVMGMSLWFVSAAILPDMIRDAMIGPARQALLSSSVQAGFVTGALLIAATGIADRLDPRLVLGASAILAAIANLGLLVVSPGGDGAILLRFLCGFLLAGVYPVGMKIAVGWGIKDRGFLVGLIVGALTLGKSLPYFWAYLSGTDWRMTILATSATALLAGLLALAIRLGPYHARALRFEPGAILIAWSDRRIRLAYLGYFGHMWELYAMWAWIAAAATASFALTMAPSEAIALARITTFVAIGLGGIACVIAGLLADRIGKAWVALAAMCVSGTAALSTAASFGGPAWLTVMLIIVWGIAIIPDSAQFSALVADNAPPDLAGSLLTLQTCLGFLLTIGTLQVTPIAADLLGWPMVLALMAFGPYLGVVAMARLIQLGRASS